MLYTGGIYEHILIGNHAHMKRGFTMALFGKKKQEEPVQQKPVSRIEYEMVYANLTDKMMRVELEGDEAYIRYVNIKQSDNLIRLVSDGIIIADIGKRGKAYKELEPHIGRQAERMTIRVKENEYGFYYNIGLKLPYTVVEA